LFVVMSGITNTPIEMTGDFSHLGMPSLSTPLDLTLAILGELGPLFQNNLSHGLRQNGTRTAV
jgi:hypothetical protein